MANSNTIMVRIEADGTAKVIDDFKGIEKSSSSMASAITSISPSSLMAAGAISALAGALAGLELKRLIEESTMMAARVETLGAVMPVVGNNAGYTAAQMNTYSQGVAKMGITTEESRQTVIRMASAQMELTKSAELSRIAQDAAVIANTNSSDALQRMIYGIVSRQPEMLRTMELNVDFEQSYRRMAIELHKSTETLTEHEKVQAATNAVIAKGKDIAGTYEAAMGTSGKQVSSLKRYHDELKLSIGEAFNPAFSVLVAGYTDALKGLLDWAKNNKPALQEFANDLKGISTAFLHPIDATTNLILDPWMKDPEETSSQAGIEIEYQKTIATIKKRQEAERIARADEDRVQREADAARMAGMDASRAKADAGLQTQMATIKNRLAKEIEAYKTQEKEQEQLLAERKVSEETYYQNKSDMEKQALTAAITALEKEKAAIQAAQAEKQGQFKKADEQLKAEAETLAKVMGIDAQIDAKRQEAHRKDIDLRIREIQLANQLALADAQSVEKKIEEQTAWQQKLDDFQVKSGRIGEEEAIDRRYERERQVLAAKEATLAVQIEQEKNDAKRLELEAQYWALEQQVRNSVVAQGQDKTIAVRDLTNAYAEINIRLQEMVGLLEEAERGRQKLFWNSPKGKQLILDALGDKPGAVDALNAQKNIDTANLELQKQRKQSELNTLRLGTQNIQNNTSGLFGEPDPYANLKNQYNTEIEATRNKMVEMEILHQKETATYQAMVERKLAIDKKYFDDKAKLDQQMWMKGAQSLANSMSSIGNTLMQGNKQQFEAGKAMAIASATISMTLGAIQAYTSMTSIPYVGPALGAIAAAAVVAAGLSNIAMIESTKYEATRAMGGSVEAGRRYLVGENGREVFTPDQNGSITPNNRLGAGRAQQVNVTVVNQISTGVSDTVRAEMMRMVPMFQQMAVSSVKQAMADGEFQGAV